MEFMVFNNTKGFKGFVQITATTDNTSAATILEKGKKAISEGDFAVEVTWERANLLD